MTHILAIDQGTTSTRAIIFDETLKAVVSAQEEFEQYYPNSGWVEHDPSDLWSTTAATCRAAIEKAGAGTGDIAAIGITNQRETTLVWTATPASRCSTRSSGRTGGHPNIARRSSRTGSRRS